MSDYSKGFSIGKVTLPGRVVLAPMAGVTDLPFRATLQGTGSGSDLYRNGQCEGNLYITIKIQKIC